MGMRYPAITQMQGYVVIDTSHGYNMGIEYFFTAGVKHKDISSTGYLSEDVGGVFIVNHADIYSAIDKLTVLYNVISSENDKSLKDDIEIFELNFNDVMSLYHNERDYHLRKMASLMSGLSLSYLLKTDFVAA